MHYYVTRKTWCTSSRHWSGYTPHSRREVKTFMEICRLKCSVQKKIIKHKIAKNWKKKSNESREAVSKTAVDAEIIYQSPRLKILTYRVNLHPTNLKSWSLKSATGLKTYLLDTDIQKTAAVKQADRQAGRILKGSSKPKKIWYTVIFNLPLAARWVRFDNRPAVSGLDPKADERHGHGQRSAKARTL